MLKDSKVMSILNEFLMILLLGCSIAFSINIYANPIDADVIRPFPVFSTESSEPWLGAYAAEDAPPDIYKLVTVNPDVILYFDAWIFNANDGDKYCVAEVGLTKSSGKDGLNPRMPANSYFSASLVAPGVPATGSDGCSGRALKRALTAMFAEDINTLASDFNKSGTIRATRPKEVKDNTKVRGNVKGISPIGFDFVVDHLPGWYADIFDYRQTSLRLVFKSLEAENGQRVCMALMGLTAGPEPENTPRFPVSSAAVARIFQMEDNANADNDEYCFNPVWERLTQDMKFSDANITNYIRQWERVAEPGLKAPTMSEVQKRYAQWNKKQQASANAAAAAEGRPIKSANRPSQDRSTCSNQCTNGDCVRTLPNGKKERWQAPQNYNALSGEWEWDISTNACGG